MPTETVQRTSGPWLIELDYLPPTINHSHYASGRRTVRTRALQRDIGIAALAAGWPGPEDGKLYSMSIVFTFPDWKGDIDNRIKPLIDAVFGPLHDHRIVCLTAEKRVIPRTRSTAVTIEALR